MNVKEPAIRQDGSLTLSGPPPFGQTAPRPGTIRAIAEAAHARAAQLEPGAAVNVSSSAPTVIDVVVIVPRLWVRKRRQSVIAGSVQFPARAAADSGATVRVTVRPRWRCRELY